MAWRYESIRHTFARVSCAVSYYQWKVPLSVEKRLPRETVYMIVIITFLGGTARSGRFVPHAPRSEGRAQHSTDADSGAGGTSK